MQLNFKALLLSLPIGRLVFILSVHKGQNCGKNTTRIVLHNGKNRERRKYTHRLLL